MTRIAICGETYSPNLGDGVIADSLKWLLKQVDASIDVSFTDFSCRPGYSLEDLSALPKANWIRRIHRSLARISLYRKGAVPLLWYFSKRKRLSQSSQERIGDCDLMLIGGGQLLMDNNLYFPLRVRELVRLAKSLNKGVVFYACGVGAKWSRPGFRLLTGALLDESVLWVSVRDQESRDTLRALFPGTNLKCRLSEDPAVCAAEAYGIHANPKSSTTGLGLSAPNVLSTRFAGSKSAFTVKRVKQFWIDLAELLESEHREFVFFTNGQSDDYAFAQSIVAEMSGSKAMRPPVLLERARQPRALVEQVAQCQAIVAHRLHANIIAYSLGIPSVGLIWDKKVEEFGKITGRSRFYFDPFNMDPIVANERLHEAISTGIDGAHLAKLKAFVHGDVKTMLSVCTMGNR
ncbi:MAG: polysaccharide pyruvyl transferase family protein [Desulfuromusa sp.]|nr:polysaccharide pyruvyl transferase family protein [Desulfuromusa sp.]